MGEWRSKAACQRADPDIFFPVRQDGAAARSKDACARALRVCRHCRVQHECLMFALSQKDDPPGVWGGTTPGQRSALRSSLGRRLA